MKILLLGHNGLLGNMVFKYLKSKNYDITVTNLRWLNDDFKSFILEQKSDFIINCIGMIPQRKPNNELYNLINYQLPIFLDNLGINVIHPDTDESDDTPYGLSKKMARDDVSKNTKIIKTSIIGFEKGTKFSFLDWFLNSEDKVDGYMNQHWNGNTTLEWAKWSEKIMLNWSSFNKITILANPDCLSKYEILNIFKDIFNKNININPTNSSITKNNCMTEDYTTIKLYDQIKEMKDFYER